MLSIDVSLTGPHKGEYKKATLLTFIDPLSSTTITATHAVEEAYTHHRTLLVSGPFYGDHVRQTMTVDDIDDLMHQEIPRAVRAEAHSEAGVGVTVCFYMLLYIAL